MFPMLSPEERTKLKSNARHTEYYDQPLVQPSTVVIAKVLEELLLATHVDCQRAWTDDEISRCAQAQQDAMWLFTAITGKHVQFPDVC